MADTITAATLSLLCAALILWIAEGGRDDGS